MGKASRPPPAKRTREFPDLTAESDDGLKSGMGFVRHRSRRLRGRCAWGRPDQIKKEVDPALTFPPLCREGICGSCAMNSTAAHAGLLNDRGDLKARIRITPLPHMPVVKIWCRLFRRYLTRSLRSIEPVAAGPTRRPPPPDAERLRARKNGGEADGLCECILCFCCSIRVPELLVENAIATSARRCGGSVSLDRRLRWTGDRAAARRAGEMPFKL